MLLAGPGAAQPGHTCENAAPEHSDGESEVHMSRVCPLDDHLLPIAADGLRLKQVSLLHPVTLHAHSMLACTRLL